MTTGLLTVGLSEQRLLELFEAELIQAMRSEGEAPTIHAFAHAVARVIAVDHLCVAEQLARAGVRLADGEAEEHSAGRT